MDVTPLIPQGQQVIQSYSLGGFKISGQTYDRAVIVTPEQTVLWTEKANLEDLDITDFETLYKTEERQDVYLLGTGTVSVFPEASLIKALKEKNIRIDFMDTGAACRTYNVLMAEGRRVAALLLPV